MQLRICENYDELSSAAAREIISVVVQKPDAVLCLAAGDTPRLTYSMLIRIVREEGIDFSKCTFIGLDEWMGIPPENDGSCQYFLRQQIFEPLNIFDDHIFLFDALTNTPEEECRKMDSVISGKGGIDLMLVGIGMNGHIGFNEPSESFGHYSHVVPLGEDTKAVGQKYFRKQTTLTRGITLGLTHLMEAKMALLLANGKKKADVIKRTLQGDITPQLPASILRNHKHGLIIIDKDAASKLETS
ncbi:MAG TPA: glucosamine-6-phosphate deaminase [Chryseolinea sp.]